MDGLIFGGLKTGGGLKRGILRYAVVRQELITKFLILYCKTQPFSIFPVTSSLANYLYALYSFTWWKPLSEPYLSEKLLSCTLLSPQLKCTENFSVNMAKIIIMAVHRGRKLEIRYLTCPYSSDAL